MSHFQKGLCGCCSNIEGSLVSCFMPCLASGLIAKEIGDSCIVWTIFGCLCPICAPVLIRSNVRKNKSIDGNFCMDCLAGCFCECCALTQCYSEVDAAMCR